MSTFNGAVRFLGVRTSPYNWLEVLRPPGNFLSQPGHAYNACMAWLAQKSDLEVSRPLTNSMGLSWPLGTSLHHWKSTTSKLFNSPNSYRLSILVSNIWYCAKSIIRILLEPSLLDPKTLCSTISHHKKSEKGHRLALGCKSNVFEHSWLFYLGRCLTKKEKIELFKEWFQSNSSLTLSFIPSNRNWFM
jgi:hypothetical protein